MADQWYYARNNQQFGPIAASRLRELVDSGELPEDALVWREGMTHWQQAGRARRLFEAGPAVQAAAPPPDPLAAIGYYSATTDIGARTMQILRGFPSPTGPRGDWPLSDAHLEQLAQAERHRKAIRSFNSLCLILVLLCAIGMIGAMGMVLSAPAARGAGVRRDPILMMGGMGLAVYVGLGVLFYICGRAALKARIWGPITVCVFLSLAIAFWVVAAMVSLGSSSRSRVDQTGTVILLMIVLAIGGTMLWVNIRGMIAIPKFLASPVWAQEALVNAKL
jgi:hypothetical protein